jgi:hypothetical protein
LKTKSALVLEKDILTPKNTGSIHKYKDYPGPLNPEKSAFSAIRYASVHFGNSSEEERNISSTRRRPESDQKNLVYCFENVLTPAYSGLT